TSEHETDGRQRQESTGGKNAKNPLIGVVYLLTTGGLIRVRLGAPPEPQIGAPAPSTLPPRWLPHAVPLLVPLLEHLVGLEEERRRNRQAQCLRGLEVDDQ